ncbi:hypothetical protein EDD36DRAFT_420762 [Exophiala viscosa]|uniref:Uncharacterized protein n=1 Tax=Exophiala viscosa TaxID=2486360 RepID=A0AAN6DSW5_9EURO|nr:hypothetical protein EDD36DRAFT_420762 [Exophiala viscosa]
MKSAILPHLLSCPVLDRLLFLADRLHSSVDKISSWIEILRGSCLSTGVGECTSAPTSLAQSALSLRVSISSSCLVLTTKTAACNVLLGDSQSLDNTPATGLLAASFTRETLFWFPHFGYLKTSSPALQVQHKANMTNQSTDRQTGRSRRYTVSRLLELAPQNRIINFDLSKFSYDAARAGVVPPLGACAMSTRRTASDKPRGWSRESSSSQEELIVYRGNRIPKGGPERQPAVPPTGDLAQQDKGFARFLEKHSSPTHQRVTAGGRIVPMEQRPRPPPFTLPHAQQDQDSGRKDNANNTGQDETIAFPAFVPDMGHQGKPNQDGTDGQVVQPPVHMLANRNVVPAAINVNLMAYPDAYAMDAASCPPPLSPGMMTAPLFPNMYDPFGMQSAQMYPPATLAITAPLAHFSGNMEAPYPMPMLAQPEVPVVPPMDPMPPPQTGLNAPDELHSNKMLQSALARYNDLDQQIKNLDRHRALGDHDPLLATQRMNIVEMRAEARSLYNYWTSIVSNDLKAIGKQAADRPTSTLNVQAAAYVPLNSTAPAAAQSSDITKVFAHGDSNGLQMTRRNTPKPGPRRIPIVAPPEKTSSAGKRFKDNTASYIGSVEVDEWGARIGEPPEDIELQQSEMLLKLSRELSISPQESTHSSTAPKSAAVSIEVTSKSATLEDHPGDHDQNRTGQPDQEIREWLPTQLGRAPPKVEACYEVQLDAMRLPKRFITTVRLPGGTITEVRGQGLRRPPSFEMDEFERHYWTSKPELTDDITANFLDVRLADEDMPANRVNDYMDSNRNKGESQQGYNPKENALVVAKTSMESLGGKQTNFVAGDQPTRSVFLSSSLVLPRFGRQAYTSIITTSTDSGGLSTFGQPLALPPNVMSRVDNRPGWSMSEHSRNGVEVPYDAANIKGHSSVSVQNVHAMGRLPHMLDGATDHQRRTAAWALSAAGGVRSPQPAQASTASASIQHGGPRDGEIGGVTLGNDGVYRPPIVK